MPVSLKGHQMGNASIALIAVHISEYYAWLQLQVLTRSLASGIDYIREQSAIASAAS